MRAKWKGCLLILLLFILSGCGITDSEKSAAVRVAVLDSGISPEKSLPIDEGWNYLDESIHTDDDIGHGTRIAEVICQYAPETVIVPLKISGDKQDTKPEEVNRAIYDAVDTYDCRVVCMAFSIPDSEELQNAVEYAASNQVILISAAGNLGETYKKNKMLYPAAYDSVIGVGAVTENGEAASYSQKNESVFVTAPASSLDGESQGTSYAAARIAGICARRTWESPEEFEKYLMDEAEDRGALGYDIEYGWGVCGLSP